MGTENTKNEIEIDMWGLFLAVLNKLKVIILIGILTSGIAFAYTHYLVKPLYVSETNVLILTKQDKTQDRFTTSDIAIATYLANDYQFLLTSEPVLQEVKDELKLDQTISEIAGMISVELKEDTRIITISVTTTNPKLSKEIADTVRDVANEKTKDVMDGIEAVNAIDEANLPVRPASPNVKKNTMLGFLLGFGLSILVVAIVFIMDDTIKTPSDIEQYLELSVLASIPAKTEDSTSKGKKGKSKRKSKKKEKKNAETI